MIRSDRPAGAKANRDLARGGSIKGSPLLPSNPTGARRTTQLSVIIMPERASTNQPVNRLARDRQESLDRFH